MEYFEITPPVGTRFAQVREAGMLYTPMCQSCRRGGVRQPPLIISFKDSKPVGDFTWLAPDVFVSDRAKDVLTKLKSKDFCFDPAIVRGHRQESVWHLRITARCHVAAECGVQLLEKCEVCQRETYSTWIGGLKVDKSLCQYDAFRLFEHWGMMFFSSAVIDLVAQAGLTNIQFAPIEQVIDSLAWMRPRMQLDQECD